jgi:hypothetical protein
LLDGELFDFRSIKVGDAVAEGDIAFDMGE